MSYYSRRDDRDDSDDAPTVSAQLVKLGGDVHNALTALREAIDGKVDRQNKAQLEKLQGFFDKYEEENQKVARNFARFEREQKEVKLALETAGSPGRNGKVNFSTTKSSEARDTPEYENFFRYAKKGKQCDGLDFKTLRTDSESQGGYLIPQVMDAQIRKNITEVSPVRSHARIRVAHSKTMDIPRRLALPIGQFEGEAESAPVDQAVYGSEQVTLYRQTVQIPVTVDMMISSAFDLEQEIVNDCAESFAQGEGKNFVSGNGRKCPQGFMTDTRCVNVTSSTSGAILWDDLSKLSGSMKMGMQPWFFCNRKTLAYLQSLKSTIGVPIWQPVSGNQPATIFGYPYDSSMIDMDDISLGSGAKPVAFADLHRAYEVFDLTGISFIRDDVTSSREAIIKYTIRRYLTGRVITPEAIGVLTLL